MPTNADGLEIIEAATPRNADGFEIVEASTSTGTTPAAEFPAQSAPPFYPSREGEGGLYTPRVDPSLEVRPLPTRTVGQLLTEGIPFHKLAASAQTVQDAFDVLKAMQERSGRTMQERLEGPTTPPGTPAKVTAGAVAAGLTVPETMTSPLGIATLGAGAAGPAVARVVSGAFAADIARHTPEQVVDVYEAFKLELGPEEATKRIGALTLSTAMLAASAKHAATDASPGAEAGRMLAKNVEATEFVKPGDLLPQPKVLEIAAVKAEAAGAPATAEAVRAQAVEFELQPKQEPLVQTPFDTSGMSPAEKLRHEKFVEGFFGENKAIEVTGEPKHAVPETIQPATETKAPVAETISPPAATPVGAPPVVDVTAPSATRTPEAGAVEAVIQAADQWKAAEKRYRRALRQEPSDVESAREARDDAEVTFRGEADKARIPQAEYDRLAQRATETETPKWTIATEDRKPLSLKELAEGKRPPGAGEAGAINLSAVAPAVKRAAKAVADTTKEALSDLRIQPLNDRRRAVLNWSAKLQQSFGEADSAQRDIRKQVPDAAQRDGITNWIQAGGDAAVLAQRASATTDPTLKAGYEAAMNLTPEALAVARDVKAAYDALGQRGRRSGVLNSFVDNYVTQIWNLNKGPAMGSSRTLKDQFRFNKARTFDTFFDGEQAGYTPKTKDISQLLPVYLHEMNAVIAARQLVAEMGDGVASDGRPLTAPSGNSRVVDGADGQAVLVTPKTIKGDTADYKRMENQPALNDWVWAGKDTDGKPIFLKSDLKLHPEAYAQLKNVLGRSAIKEWYDTRTSLMAAIPKALVKGIDWTQTETKKTMLGFFAPFHQVQEGTHAVGHRVNPFFNNPKIDLVNNAAQMDAARHGLMLLPDRVSANNFMEGYRTSGLVSKIPYIGRAADWYSHYLFHEYIPGIKFKTYEAILKRNTDVYAKDIAARTVSVEDVKALSASQANAAYGHLNYADLARNPTIQHLMRLGLLAPDFLEARARFAGQAIKGVGGAKVGREQVLAIATLAITQATLAYIAAEITGGEWDGSRPFEFTKNGRRYTMRSVPEDAASLMRDIDHVFKKGGETPFISHRLSPLVGRGGMQLLSGRDYRGRQVTPLQTAGELAKTPIPLTLRGAAGELPWVGDMLKPNTSLSIPEQLWSAVGIKISVDRPEKPEKPKHEKPKYKP